MDTTGPIRSAEHKFKQILEKYFINVFDNRALESHGIDHHRRVWSYSKILLNILSDQKHSTSGNLPQKLIIASYLHDLGMSVDPGLKHGKYSRDLCKIFLDQNQLNINDYSDVLDAIENHDRKDYEKKTSNYDLLHILSVADDLDAFGFIGVFRYTEIYLLRGIKLSEVGNMILENANQRFDNFVHGFRFSEELISIHKKRFDILENFFKEYNNQTKSYKFIGSTPYGYCGVVEMLLKMTNEKKSFIDLFKERDKYKNDLIICWYFKELEKELSSFLF